MPIDVGHLRLLRCCIADFAFAFAFAQSNPNLVGHEPKWTSPANAFCNPTGSVTEGSAPKAANPESSLEINSLCDPIWLNQGWGTFPLPRIQAVLSIFKRSISSRRGCCFFIFDSRVFFFSRVFLAGQLSVQDRIEHVSPFLWVHWIHTKWCQGILTCFFCIFLQLLQFHIALPWLSLARFTVSRSSFWPQIEGHLTNNCADVVVCVSVCEPLGSVILPSVCIRNVMSLWRFVVLDGWKVFEPNSCQHARTASLF